MGQEQDGSLLAAWISTNQEKFEKSNIGIYNPNEKTFDILYSFKKRENVIQASVNSSRTLLGFMIKDEKINSENESVYKANIVAVEENTNFTDHVSLDIESTKQIMIQFLWTKLSNPSSCKQEKFLILTHEESITLYTCFAKKNPEPDLDVEVDDVLDTNLVWDLDPKTMKTESIVKTFTWAQWDPSIQALYYIHLKPVSKILLEKEENQPEKVLNPTLSAYQFHDDLPTETVVSKILSIIHRSFIDLIFILFIYSLTFL